MTSAKEVVQQVRSGKLSLPADRMLRSLVVYALLELGFNPLQRDFAKEFDEENSRQEKEFKSEQERADKERKKRVDELAAHLVDLVDESELFEFKIEQTQQRLGVKATSVIWPLSPETRCPKAGKRIEFENLLVPLLAELAELVISGHYKKNPTVADCILFLSKHMGSYDKWTITCGETRCIGIQGTRCGELSLRLVQKNQ